MVYVLSKSGKPIMPTERNGWVRRCLRDKKAKVVSRFPFTIQLLFDSSEVIQETILGVDAGFGTIGASVTSNEKELYAAEIKLRKDVSEKVSERRMYRRTRRGKNTRYRAARFDNRKRKTLQPSVKQKIESHEQVIKNIQKILPISKIIVEGGNFDMAKINNPEIKGTEYQKGPQKGFYNVKQYVLARDSYSCQAGAKGCSEKLHVHHIVFRSNGGSNAPSNLICLCEKHHDALHKGKIKLNVKKHKSLKSATMMNVVRSQLFKRNPHYAETFGYETKFEREALALPKTHNNDAFVIARGTTQKRAEVFKIAQKRKNNRGIQLNRKGFAPAIRKQRYKIQPKDIIEYKGQRYLAGGILSKGRQVMFKDESGKKVYKSTKEIKVIFHQKTFFKEAV